MAAALYVIIVIAIVLEIIFRFVKDPSQYTQDENDIPDLD